MAQTLEAVFYQGSQRRIDHTPVGAVANGEIISLGGLVAVCTSPEGIAAGAKGAVDIDGTYKVKKGAVAFSEGDLVEWDDVGNNAVAQAGGTFDIGVCTEDAAVGDDHVKVWINKAALQ